MKHTTAAQREPQPVRTWKQRIALWLPAAGLLVLLVAVAGGAAGWFNRETDTRAATPPAGASVAKIPEEARGRLQGRWLRPDGGYVMTIKSVDPDGKVEATYANPRPIHVASAQAAQADGKTTLRVELRDTNYPGNYYTLAYDPAQDQLVGVYHHLGNDQDFEVNFTRMR
jgi:uncharacterized protein (DUF2147 family)